MAIENDTIVAYTNGNLALYKLINTEWTEVSSIIPQGLVLSEISGLSLDLKGNRIIMGSYTINPDSEFSGSAYIFEFDGIHLVQKQRILPGNNALTIFGLSVKFLNDIAIIGSPVDYNSNAVLGEIYVYQLIENTWIKKAIIQNELGKEADFFGVSISIDNDYILAGLPRSDYQGTKSGAATIIDLSSVFNSIFKDGFDE